MFVNFDLESWIFGMFDLGYLENASAPQKVLDLGKQQAIEFREGIELKSIGLPKVY